MKVYILYATMSGHSKKIAEAISKSIGIQAYNLKEDDLPPCDLLFIVSGIYGGENKPELLDFAKKVSPTNIKRVVQLTSSARGSAQGSLRTILSQRGIAVDPQEYLCTGSFLFAKMGHPNRSEIEGAVSFVKTYMEGIAKG